MSAIKSYVYLLFPMTVGMGLFLFGLLILWFTTKQRLARIVLTIAAAFLLLFSTYPFPNFLLENLEKQYPPLMDNEITDKYSGIKYIVILGATVIPDKRLPMSSQLYSSSLARTVEGARLYFKLPHAKLIVSGGGRYPSAKSADFMARFLEDLGVNKNKIILEKKSLNTYEEAILLKHVVTDDSFLLVTSAYHMPRSMALFKKQGMNPVAAPTDYQNRNEGCFHYTMLLPSAGNIEKADIAFYEYLGFVKENLLRHI